MNEVEDVGLGPLQFKEFNPDLIIHVVSQEQIAYFQVVLSIGPAFSGYPRE